MANALTPFELVTPLESIPEFDMVLAQNELIRFSDIDTLISKSKAIKVSDEDTAKNALSMALQSRKLDKAIEDSRQQIIRPHLDFQRAVNKMAKDFKQTLEVIEERLHTKIEDWMKDQKDNPFTMTDSLSVEDGMIYTKQNWEFEIIDQNQVPPEFLCVDKDAIDKAVKNGLRNIPGVKIFSTETTHLRIKNT